MYYHHVPLSLAALCGPRTDLETSHDLYQCLKSERSSVASGSAIGSLSSVAQVNVVELLLSKGANINDITKNGQTAIYQYAYYILVRS